MNQETYYLKQPNSPDLFVRYWNAHAAPRGTVVIVHGFTEHSGRYEFLAKLFGKHGLNSVALDLQGHGQSSGSRVYVNRFGDYLDDLDRLLDDLAARSAEPLFIFGHSMGGAIVALHAIERRPKVRGIILSAPAVRVGKRIFPILRHLARMVSFFFPRLRLLNFGFGWISRDPNVVEAFRNDPLIHHGSFPVRTGSEILMACRRIQLKAPELTQPLLILQGGGDRVVDPAGAPLLHEKAGSTDKQLKMYDGLYHSVTEEPEKDQVQADLMAWIDERC